MTASRISFPKAALVACHSDRKGLRRWCLTITAMVMMGMFCFLPYCQSAWYGWQGDHLERSGNRQAALSAYEKSAQLHRTPETLEKLGRAYYQTQQIASAIITLQEATQMAPASVPSHVLLSQAYLHSGNVAKAKQEALQAIALDPESGLAHLAMSEVWEALGNYNAADRELEWAVLHGANTPEAHFQLGCLYMDRADPRAETEIQAAMDLRPVWPEAELRMGFLLMGKAPEQADTLFRRAIEQGLSPQDHARASAALACLAFDSGDMVAARGHLQTAETLQPDSTTKACLLYANAVIHHKTGDALGASYYFNAADHNWPQENTLQIGSLVGKCSLYGAAMQAQRSGDNALSEACLRSLIAMDPENPEYHLQMGNVLMQRRHPDMALTEYRMASADDPEDPEPMMKQAVALLHLNRNQESLDMMNLALQADPLWVSSRPDVDLLLGQINLACNHPQIAEGYLKQALSSRSTLVNGDECVALLRIAGDRIQRLNFPTTGLYTVPQPSPAPIRPIVATPKIPITGNPGAIPPASSKNVASDPPLRIHE